MKKWLAIVLSGIALVTMPQAQALTLSEYVSDVVKSHPSIRQQLHYYRQVVQDLEVTGSGWRPSVDLTLNTGRHSTKSPITSQQRNNYNSSLAKLTVTQNLFNGYDTTHQERQNRSRLYSAMYELYDMADNVALEAIMAYFEAIKQQRLVMLAEKNVESHNRIMAHLRERNDSGMGRRSELEQTEGRVAQAHASLVAQQNNYYDAMTKLHKMLGRYENEAELKIPANIWPPIGEMEPLIDELLKNNPAILSAHYNLEASKHQYLRSKSGRYPQIDLQLEKQIGSNLNGLDGATDDLGLMLNLTYNLYNGGAYRAETRKMVSLNYANQEYVKDIKRQAIDKFRLAWVSKAALKQQLIYLEVHVQSAKQTAKTYREEFYIGQRDLLDLLDSESELNAALIGHTNARFDAFTSDYRVFEGLGRLFQPLGLDFEVSGDAIKIVNLQTNQLDEFPLRDDVDTDAEADPLDHCDNTVLKSSVDAYGCHNNLNIEFGYKVPLPPRIEMVNFVFDKTDLTKASLAKFDRIIEQLNNYPMAEIEFYAHTDKNGTDKYNDRLAEKRAQAMLALLIDRGIDSRRIKVFGMGETTPLSIEDTEEIYARNRRGEFRIILY